MHLDSSERDAIAEMLNMGMGSAVDAMSTMVHEKVILSVPRVELIKPMDQLASRKLTSGRIISVSQEFSQGLQGVAHLIIPESSGSMTARALLPPQLKAEDPGTIEDDVLKGLGNIVLHSLFVSMGRFLNVHLVTEAPILGRGMLDNLHLCQDSNSTILCVDIDFGIPNLGISGLACLVMEEIEVGILQEKVQDVLASLMRH